LNQPNPARLEWATRLLAHEVAAGGEGEPGAAAGRVYDKLHASLAPLLGAAGVDALFARSVMLVQGEFASFGEASVLGGAPKLRASLRAQDPAIAPEAAVALFGTFLALITTFIGERLAAQVLRSAWPTFEHRASKETKA
jgi:hypothetical protein